MNRIRRQVALLGLLSLVSRPAPAQPARSNPPKTTEQFIDVDGRTLHLRVGGSGTPTVVLDSGLGDLPPSYTAAEFQRYRVAGESLDSGLGDLPASYAAAEFQRYRVAGESLDSGLGHLSPSYTAAEFQKQIVVAER